MMPFLTPSSSARKALKRSISTEIQPSIIQLIRTPSCWWAGKKDFQRSDQRTHLFLKGMGTAGKIEGQRGVFQGKFGETAIARQIESYFEEYVVCTECRLPDTHLLKSDRVLTLKCDACGAHRPVRKRKAATIVQKDVIEEGETYELRIESVGNKGDGIAKVDKYLIFVPGAVKGEIVKAKIKKISGTLAFAEVVERTGKVP